MASHNNTGFLGERMAEDYLKQKNLIILDKNWRHGNWEIDFIASSGEVLHFIEIKTRRSTRFGMPEEGVSKKKMTNLINASEEYLVLHPEWKRIQFDILSINLNKNLPPEFFFIEDVYIPL